MNRENGPGNIKKRPVASFQTMLLVLGASAISFLAGTQFAANFNQCSSLSSPQIIGADASKGISMVAEVSSRKPRQALETKESLARSINEEPLFPETVQKFAYGMSHVTKQEFTDKFELGVPLDIPSKGSEGVIIMYNSRAALPKNQQSLPQTSVNSMSIDEAVENCEFMNVILTHHDSPRKQCTAIIPQYESYHIQKWMRVKEGKKKMELDLKNDLVLVPRGQQPNGIDSFKPPVFDNHTRRSWELLKKYLASVDDVLAELKPIVDKIKIKNTVIVMVCNHGQSELLVNFACSTHSRGLDTSNILVFATDEETKELAESVGLAAYYDERNFGHITSNAAEQYGDRNFVAMMMAKVYCVQLVSLLGVDMLFQDVDIVWYKNPLDFFHNKDSPIYFYDMYYQDDGSHSTRYAPWAPNSGFYYVRQNERTKHFLTSLLMSGDLVLKTFSHQQAMTAVLAEHASLFGLRVKVLSRDEDDFPGGYHFHRKNGEFLRDMFAGTRKPYIFHMSWTKNKDNKLLFMRQMGEWYLQEKCVAKTFSEIPGSEKGNFVENCCSKDALITCHYRDKPSIKPCKDSPTLDKGKASWW